MKKPAIFSRKKFRPSPAVLREMAKCRKVLGLPKREPRRA